VTITLAPRTRRVGDAAIAVLAEHGARGLTHRAVDQAAGLPSGTTSNYARTRSALLELTLARIAELDAAESASGLAGSGSYESELSSPGLSGPGLSGFGLADVLAGMLHRTITDSGARQRVLARFELAFEATRRPELRAAYNDLGRRFRGEAARLLAAAGSAEPERDAWTLIAFMEGTAFYALAGAGAAAPPAPAALRAQLAALVVGMCADEPGAA
jgi:DNA-binding transcriptional regulator YbjK